MSQRAPEPDRTDGARTGYAGPPAIPGGSDGPVGRAAYPWWLEQFPRRRVVVAVVLWPVLFIVLTAAAGAAAAGSMLWTVLLVVTSGLAALTLSTYVPTPGTGSRVEVGCEPCARIAGASVLGSILLLTMANPNPTAAVAPLLLAGAGLVQRVRGSRSCPTGA